MEYPFKEIEAQWKDFYEQDQTFSRNLNQTDSGKPKYYCLEMFPYPSGDLHIGHARNYTIGDVLARYKTHKGFDVLHPIGWDAFGLPAENAAIEKKTKPATWTFANIDRMRAQLKDLGISYDWKNEICTAKPEYYHWGQWIFLKLYEKGLVYRKKAAVYWDPIDKTVLAKEQVQEGKAWRSGATVEKRIIEQWYVRITDYAEELLVDLDKLPGWPEKVKIMQRNWIGKSEGAVVNFKHGVEDFLIFTTRPDTIYGVSFMAIAFDHENLAQYIKGDEAHHRKINKFVEKCKQIDQNTDYHKEGLYTGTDITHPLTGKPIPLYVANFVLAEYGTGAVMGVPAHDQRDFEFAKEYQLPILPVIIPSSTDDKSDNLTKTAYSGEGVLINSDVFDGLGNRTAIKEITAHLEKHGLGKRQVQYKLKDWLISRQRYWGNPIPMLHDNNGEYRPEKTENLPVVLPDLSFSGNSNPLENYEPFTKVEENGKTFWRETDTMDTFTCSSWYFLRHIDPNNSSTPFSTTSANRWMPVDQYIGGIEHACMHLLYARFLHKSLRDLGLLKCDEPFTNLLTQGMVVGPSYYSPHTKRYYSPSELSNKTNCPVSGEPLVVKVEKMSKSKKNGVDPGHMISSYGADSVRLFILFAAPPEKDLEWNEGGIEGCQRFIMKVVRWSENIFTAIESNQVTVNKNFNSSNPTLARHPLNKVLHQTIHKVEEDIKKLHFNTAVAAMMSFMNEAINMSKNDLEGDGITPEQIHIHLNALETLCVLLSPFAPFIVEELNHRIETLYQKNSPQKSISKKAWPSYDPASLVQDKVTVPVQINGKVRAKLTLANNTPETVALEQAQKNQVVESYLEGKTILRKIVIPNRMISFVIK